MQVMNCIEIATACTGFAGKVGVAGTKAAAADCKSHSKE